MLTFQLIGMAFTGLFLASLVTSNPRAAGR